MHWREKKISRLIWHASRWNKFLKMKWRKTERGENPPQYFIFSGTYLKYLGPWMIPGQNECQETRRPPMAFISLKGCWLTSVSIITASLVQHILGILCLIYMSCIERSVIQIPSYRLTTTMSTGSETARIVIIDLKWSKLFTSLIYSSGFSSASCLCWLRTQSCLIDLDMQLPLILWGAGHSNSFLKSQFFCLSWLRL